VLRATELLFAHSARCDAACGCSTSSLDDMGLDSGEIERILDAEVSRTSAASIVALIGKLRIRPQLQVRRWNYGAPHEYPCWLVLADPVSNVGVAYCAHGFGPKSPWGLLWLSGRRSDMGDDSGWFSSLADAVTDGWDVADNSSRHVV
jgi:hypothetical protein